MLLILSNTPISKHYNLCLNVPVNKFSQNFYVKIHVIKHDMDPNSNINYSRKIPPLSDHLKIWRCTLLPIFYKERRVLWVHLWIVGNWLGRCNFQSMHFCEKSRLCRIYNFCRNIKVQDMEIRFHSPQSTNYSQKVTQ